MNATLQLPKKLFAMKTSHVIFTPIEGSGEARDFSPQISELTVTVSTGTSVMAVSGHNYPGDTTYGANLSLYQDIDPAGFLRFLWDNEGKKYTMRVNFVDGADALEGTVTLVPAGIGGQASTDLPTSSITLTYDGKPTWVAPSRQE